MSIRNLCLGCYLLTQECMRMVMMVCMLKCIWIPILSILLWQWNLPQFHMAIMVIGFSLQKTLLNGSFSEVDLFKTTSMRIMDYLQQLTESKPVDESFMRLIHTKIYLI